MSSIRKLENRFPAPSGCLVQVMVNCSRPRKADLRQRWKDLPVVTRLARLFFFASARSVGFLTMHHYMRSKPGIKMSFGIVVAPTRGGARVSNGNNPKA